jgi:multidrug resistance efflux pump
MTDIFRPDGRIDTGIDPQMIHPDRRAAYTALAAAQRMTEEAEANQKAADDTVAQAVKDHDAARLALPRRDFMDEWRANRT